MQTVAKSRRKKHPTITTFSCWLMEETDGRDAGGSNSHLEDMFVRYTRGIDHKEEKVPPHRCQPTRSTFRQRGALGTIDRAASRQAKEVLAHQKPNADARWAL
jgi:hypothetical protein